MRMDVRLIYNMVAAICVLYSTPTKGFYHQSLNKCLPKDLIKLRKNWNPCFECVCEHEGKSEICRIRKITCPPTQCSYLETDKRVCCKVCKGCSIKGRYYKHQEKWTYPTDKHTTYQCNEGVVSNITPRCVTTNCARKVTVKGERCARCQGCMYRGRVIPEGTTSRISECTECKCQNNTLKCMRETCPHLYCINPKRKPGLCCPQCPKTISSQMDVPRIVDKREESCFIKGQKVETGKKYMVDKCTTCQCTNGTLSCIRRRCEKPKDCNSGKLVKSESHCCPICADKIRCKFNGKVYPNRATWFLRGCAVCECADGHIKCKKQLCKKDLKCPKGFMADYRPGSCCKECLQEKKRCISFGDPHYRTFDGKAYSFQGICKYTLTKDCTEGRTFSIIARNDGRYSNTFSWIRSIVFKYANLTISLQQKHRVKINGKLVKVPVLIDSHIDIRRVERYIFVYTKHGVAIKWDGEGYVEVGLPKTYENRVCGLCGNYNNNPDDDFTLPDGVNLRSEIMFGNYWRKRGSKSCKKKSHLYNRLKFSSCVGWRISRAHTICTKAFSDPAINACKKTLSIDTYFNDCVTDVCQCPSATHHCECGAIRSYYEECSQVGNQLSWTRKTKCDTTCVGGSVYKQCGNACRNSCESLNSVEVCTRTCVPGCHCPRGQVWHQERCIPINHCP